MKYLVLKKIIGVSIEDNYPMNSSLGLLNSWDKTNKDDFDYCSFHLNLKYQKKNSLVNTRQIESNIFIGERMLVDSELGVKIERIDKYNITITASQPCPEWLGMLVELLLLESGYAYIHAASLERKGKALLVPSWGGVGKTGIVANLVKNNDWKLLSDDITLLSADGVLPHFSEMSLYTYHKELFPDVFKADNKYHIKINGVNKIIKRVSPAIKSVLRPFPKVLTFLRKTNPGVIKAYPKDIFSANQLSSGGCIDTVIWLDRTTDNRFSIEEISIKQLISRITSVSLIELFAKRTNILFNLCGNGLFDLQDVINSMEMILEGNIKDAKLYKASIPKDVSINDVGNKFKELLEEIGID